MQCLPADPPPDTVTTNPGGQTATSAYDPAGNKTGTTYSDGTTHAEAYTYTAANQQATMADATGTTTNTYDSLGRLTAQTNGNGQTVGYTWDLAGQLTAIAYPNGQSVTRAYDTAGRLTGITDWAGHTTTFTPDPDGNTTTTTYPNGVTAANTYGPTGALSGISDTGPGSTALASFAYTRNNVDNLTATTVTGITAPNETYAYSSRDQLTGVNTSTYAYDPVGNSTALANGATLAYDAASQPTTYTLSGVTTNLSYDAQGNRTSGPGPNGTTANYTWDQANRLTNANGATATYNAAGLRATRTPAGGATAHYAWDVHGPVPLMLTEGTTSYLYDDAGHPVEQIDTTGTVLYYQHDQYGSTRLLTDATGSVAATYAYDAYGNLTAKTGTADTVLRWNGQSQDTDTGLYYLRARYFDPQTAQFITVDPLTQVTKAVYSYAHDNPLNKTDPLGLFTMNDSEGGTAPEATSCDQSSPAVANAALTASMATSCTAGDYTCISPQPEGCYSFNAYCAAKGGLDPKIRCVYNHIGIGAIGGVVAGASKAALANFVPGLGQAAWASSIILGAAGGAVGGAYNGLVNFCLGGS